MKHVAERARGLAIALIVAGMASGEAMAESGLEGTWLARDARRAGVDALEIIGHRLSFEGGRFRITKAGKLLFGGTFSVEPSAQPPAIQFEQTETQSLAGAWRGIYALDGDTLTICDNAPDMTLPRPQSFAECVAPGYIVVRFTRL